MIAEAALVPGPRGAPGSRRVPGSFGLPKPPGLLGLPRPRGFPDCTKRLDCAGFPGCTNRLGCVGFPGCTKRLGCAGSQAAQIGATNNYILVCGFVKMKLRNSAETEKGYYR